MLRCARIDGAGKPLVVESRPFLPTPERGLRIKTAFAGICHSDLHFIDDEIAVGDNKTFRLRDEIGEDEFKTIVPGHEICRIVEEIGEIAKEEGSELAIRDKVVVYPWVGCQLCTTCQSGYSNQCENNKSTTTDMGQGRTRLGGYSSHVFVPFWKHALKIPETIPLEIACMLPCSALTAYNSLIQTQTSIKQSEVQGRKPSLLLIGCGGLGLWACALAKHVFNGIKMEVIAADINDDRLIEAQVRGATKLVKIGGKTLEEMLNSLVKIRKDKIDAVIDFVGSSQTANLGLRVLHNGGTYVPVGLGGALIELSLPIIITKSLAIKGMRTGQLQLFQTLLDIVASNKVSSPKIEKYKLENVNEALEMLRKGKVNGRALIEYS